MAKGGFRGVPGGNMQQMMRQAQKLQQQMLEMSEALDAKEYTATAGGGTVTCTISGKHQIKSLSINPEAFDPEDIGMLEDMVMVAVNDALTQGDEDRETQMSRLGGMSGMGGLF